MPESPIDQLQSQISKGDIQSLYLFHGPEEWLKEKMVEQIKLKLFAEGGADLNLNVFDGSRDSAGEILTVVQTIPFLSTRRLVLVRNAELVPSSEAKILAEGLEQVPSFSCLILMYRGKANRKDPIPAKVPEAQVFTFWPPFPSQLPSWVSREVSRRGKTIDREAAQGLAEMFPNNLQDLSSEIEKLILYTQDSPQIKLSDVEELASPSETTAPWEVESAVQQKDLKGTLTKINTLFKQGRSPESILNGMERTVRTMLIAKTLEEQGTPPKDLPRHFGIRGITREENFLKGLRRYRKGELENFLLGLERCEWEIKTGSLNGEIALTTFLVRLLRQRVN